VNKVTYVNDAGREIEGQIVHLADGTVVMVSVNYRNRRGNHSSSYWAAARMYGACDALIPALNAAEPPYVAYTDEDSTPEEIAAEKAWLSWRRRALKAAKAQVTELLAALGETKAKATFSYKAGCTCGCSPGFVIKGSTFGNVDLWVRDLEGYRPKVQAVAS
jgi:hypothetical protein